MLADMAERTFELSAELSARLDEIAAATGQSATDIIQAALRQRLEQIEDELNDGLLGRIAERLQQVDYAAMADAAIEKIAANEMSPDPLDSMTSGASPSPTSERQGPGAAAVLMRLFVTLGRMPTLDELLEAAEREGWSKPLDEPQPENSTVQ